MTLLENRTNFVKSVIKALNEFFRLPYSPKLIFEENKENTGAVYTYYSNENSIHVNIIPLCTSLMDEKICLFI